MKMKELRQPGVIPALAVLTSLLALLCVAFSSAVSYGQTVTYIAPSRSVGAVVAATAASGAASSVDSVTGTKSYQVTGSTSSGSGSAVVSIEGSNDGSNWDSLGTITLTLGVTATSNSFTSHDRYKKVRANVTTLTGTGASVVATMGY